MYSELDQFSCELRKVEVYADGRMGFADAGHETGETRLSEEPLPSLGDIARDPQFEPAEISAAEFEAIWRKALVKKG